MSVCLSVCLSLSLSPFLNICILYKCRERKKCLNVFNVVKNVAIVFTVRQRPTKKLIIIIIIIIMIIIIIIIIIMIKFSVVFYRIFVLYFV